MEFMVEPEGIVLYPDTRLIVEDSVRNLSDPDYQRRIWIERQYPHGNFVDDLGETVETLYDMGILPSPQDLSGGRIVYSNEIDPLEKLASVLVPLVEELRNRPDDDYLADERWPKVVDAAKSALRVMMENDARIREACE